MLSDVALVLAGRVPTLLPRLGAVAARRELLRAEPLATVTAAVDAAEAGVASYVTGPAQRDGLDRAMADVAERVTLLREQQGG